MEYCDNCGHTLEVRRENKEWYCRSCKLPAYANPVPTCDVMLFDEAGRILLGRRNHEPDKGMLNLPGGFVDPNETLEQAIARELQEELGLRPSDYGALTYGGSRVMDHKEEGRVTQILVVVMVGHMPHREFEANEEVDEYVWKLPSELHADECNEAEYKHILQIAATVSGAYIS